jgi:signal peptidase I
MKKFWNAIKDYVYIVIVVVLIRTFLVTPALVDGDSMNDNLYNNDLVIINKLVYRISDIKRFDIVVVKNDFDKDKIIKRVIALPNETLIYRNNKLYIDGKEIKTDIKFKDTEDFEYTTKDGEYFVLGDNRPNSKDSRYLGPFKKDKILGRVLIRLFPFNKIGKID